jgi:hypothetical protein
MALYSPENLFPQIHREFHKIECNESLKNLVFFLGHKSPKKCGKKIRKKKNLMELRVFLFQFCCGPAIVHKRNEPNLATHRSIEKVRNISGSHLVLVLVTFRGLIV